MRERPLLILDLDETLVCSVVQPQDPRHQFQVNGYAVFVRPHLDSFLKQCATVYDIAVWSSGSDEYVQAIVAHIFVNVGTPVFVWTRERCSQRYDSHSNEVYFLKDLKKAVRRGYVLKKIVIVEDEPKNVQNQYGNAVLIKPYHGDANDNALLKLAPYLVKLGASADVRRVDKRAWSR